MRKLLLLLTFFISSLTIEAQCPAGVITLSSQAEVNAFTANFPGCTQLNNELVISGADITDLTPLSVITSIGSGNNGGLTITNNPVLPNLNGLENLTDLVGGSILVTNNSTLTSISGLSGLNGIVGGISIVIQDNPSLLSLNGLQNIQQPGDDDLIIWNNDSLTDLSGLDGLVSADDILIYDNDNLINFNGLSSFQATGSFWIRNNSSLTSLNGLSSSGQIFDLEIENNASLTDISAMVGITDPPGGIDILIKDNPVLSSLSGLGGFESVNRLEIDNNDALVDFTGLGNTSFSAREVFVINNDMLTSFNGVIIETFASGLDRIEIGNNAQLQTVDGLENYTDVLFELRIYDNPSLQNLDGFSGLTNLFIGPNSTTITITNNPSLTSVFGLSDIPGNTLTQLTITDNTSLSSCSISSFCDFLDLNPGTGATIMNNASGCDTRPEVEANCLLCPSSVIMLTSQAEVDNFANAYPGCTQLQNSLTIVGSGITNLNGLSQVVSVTNDLQIFDTSITNLSGLDNLEAINGGSLQIESNINLQNLNALGNLQSIGDRLVLKNNPQVQNLNGLGSLTSLGAGQSASGGLYIENNSAINSLNGISALTVIDGSLDIDGNGNLPDLTGLENLVEVTTAVTIEDNGVVTLQGLNNLSTIGFILRIVGNDNLEDFSGLESLTSIDGSLTIRNNPVLSSVYGLANLDGATLQNILSVEDNLLLSNCDIEVICENVTNPNVQVIIDNNNNGCNTVQQIVESCSLNVSDFQLNSLVELLPNPVGEYLFITTSDSIEFRKAIVYTVSGVELTVHNSTEIQTSQLSSGIYFVKIETDRGYLVRKIVKE